MESGSWRCKPKPGSRKTRSKNELTWTTIISSKSTTKSVCPRPTVRLCGRHVRIVWPSCTFASKGSPLSIGVWSISPAAYQFDMGRSKSPCARFSDWSRRPGGTSTAGGSEDLAAPIWAAWTSFGVLPQKEPRTRQPVKGSIVRWWRTQGAHRASKRLQLSQGWHGPAIVVGTEANISVFLFDRDLQVLACPEAVSQARTMWLPEVEGV